MIETLDSTGFRLIGYLVVVAVALLAWFRERRAATLSRASYWPTFCLISAALVFTLFVIRWRDLDDNLAIFGRDQAYADGWYEGRRVIQTAFILGVTAAWFLLVMISIWRVPVRRRRYLPAAMMLYSIWAFDAIRAVSFHDVDGLLYRHSFLGFRFITYAELTGLIAMGTALLWHPFVEEPKNAERAQPSAAGVGGR